MIFRFAIPMVLQPPAGSLVDPLYPLLISLVACELKAAENDYQLFNSILNETHFYRMSWEFTF